MVVNKFLIFGILIIVYISNKNVVVRLISMFGWKWKLNFVVSKKVYVGL